MFFWHAAILIVVLILLVHFFVTSRDSDGMALFVGKEYKEFLKKKRSPSGALTEIPPPPPDGKRDVEVEALLKAGNYRAAEQLLVMRMEQARMAPIGRDGKIAKVSYYMSLLRKW